MLTLKTVATGSDGNCYILDSGKEILILDCGISMKKIKSAIGWDISKISAVLVTHGHNDHVLSAEEFKRMGVLVWQPYLDGTKSQYHQFGSFYVQSFEVPHNSVPCVGYFVQIDGQKILYATDFEYIPQSFKNVGLNHILIECNHIKELVENDLVNREHVLRGHSELQTVVDFVRHNKSNALRTVILCHLSRENADPSIMVNEVRKTAGKGISVDVAKKDFEVELRESG